MFTSLKGSNSTRHLVVARAKQNCRKHKHSSVSLSRTIRSFKLPIYSSPGQISFKHNTLVTVSNPITPIPFVDAESQKANKALKSEIKPFARILKIKARTRHPIAIDVSNSEIHQGYLPRTKIPEGLYIGEAAVTARDGKCHVLAINTTGHRI